MSFAAPLFLLGMLGMFLPWLLHRLNERQAPVQDFPSERFLQPTQAISARQRRLRYLRLLVLRLLLLAVLCLLFAEPLFKPRVTDSAAAEQLHVLVLDQSFSMRAEGRWQQAQQRVEALLDELSNTQPVQLYGTTPSLSLLRTATLDREAVRAQVRSMVPGYGTLDFETLMRELDGQAARASLPVVVHLITDAQSSLMPTRLRALLANAVTELQVLTVSGSEDNAAIVSAELADDGERFDLDVTVQHHGVRDAVDERRLVISIGAADVLERTVQPERNGVSRFTVEDIAWPAGSSRETVAATLTPSDVLVDDDRFLVPNRADTAVVIYLLSNGPADSDINNARLFLSTALSLDQRTELRSGFVADVVPVDADIVIWIGATMAGGILPDTIEAWLERGGQLLALTAPTGAAVQAQTVSHVDPDHPLSLKLEDWVEVAVYRSPADGVAASGPVLISTDSGQPLLTEIQRERGHQLVLNSMLNGTDSNLPVSPVFVPFLQSVVNYFTRLGAYPSRLYVGNSVKLGQQVQIFDPDGEAMLDLAATGDRSQSVLTRPGIYVVRDAGGEHLIQVTTDPRESDLRQADSTLLANWQAPQRPSTPETSSRVTDAHVLDGRPLVSITSWLLPLTVLLLLSEILFANRHLRVRRSP